MVMKKFRFRELKQLDLNQKKMISSFVEKFPRQGTRSMKLNDLQLNLLTLITNSSSMTTTHHYDWLAWKTLPPTALLNENTNVSLRI